MDFISLLSLFKMELTYSVFRRCTPPHFEQVSETPLFPNEKNLSTGKSQVGQREEGNHIDFDALDSISHIVPIQIAAGPLNKLEREV